MKPTPYVKVEPTTKTVSLTEEVKKTYQERYVAHQAKKKEQLMTSEGVKSQLLPEKVTVKELLAHRRSQRVFNNEPISDENLWTILEAATTAPSSCNRHGLKMKVISDRREKELLSGILVGGVGWVQRAQKIILFLADPIAYASPNEKDFMHYCDVGFTAMSMWLTAESLHIGASYINPNVFHKDIMDEKFSKGYIFCGALVLSHYDTDKRAKKSDPGVLTDMLI